VPDINEVTKVFSEKISELEAKISEYEAKISAYAAVEAADLKVKKTDLIASFTSLTEEETKDVRDNINSYSLDEIDAKLSILFAHKEKEKQKIITPAAVFTAKIDNEDTVSTLPEFMKIAKEYDESRKVNISLN
jgi:23S rRNA pseudoU1915 N3-methylase RlmH